MLRLIFVVLALLLPVTAIAQAPADLREAMRARDRAVALADASTWDRLTADDFTVVQEDGVLMTKAERLAQMKMQKPGVETPVQRESVKRYGDAYVRRFLFGDVWVLEMWTKSVGGWRNVAVQVTTAKK